VTATNPAKLFGLYPAKGTIAVGSDADLVVWDPDESRTIRDEDALSNSGFSIHSGREVTGWPVMTIRRGEVVFEDGRVTGAAGSGRLAPRGSSQPPD
jgi:dihydropyrimidinase